MFRKEPADQPPGRNRSCFIQNKFCQLSQEQKKQNTAGKCGCQSDKAPGGQESRFKTDMLFFLQISAGQSEKAEKAGK